MRVYLIGMPGSGKSTVGRDLAKKINYEHIDLDGLVEKEALMFIDDLIERYGINTFRALEKEVLSNVKLDNAIISCGGGIVLDRTNKELMDGIIVYLDVDNKIITERLKNDYERPLLKEKSIDDLYRERFLLYQHFADVIVSNEKEIETTINDLIEKIGTNLWKKYWLSMDLI